MRVDAIYRNGQFWTGDPNHPEARQIAVHQGRIIAIDELDGIEPKAEVDLGGARVVPGLHDAHHHLGLTGLRLANVDVRPSMVSTLDELYTALEERAAQLPQGSWVLASGYDQNFLGGVHPTADAIDKAVGGRPCMLEHVSGHMIVANTRAFELAGYPNRERYPNIDGGRVFRDDDGRAQGLLQETAMNPIRDAAATLSDADILRNLKLASDQSVAYGLTSITEPGVVVDGRISGGTALHHYLSAIADGIIRPRMTVMPFHSTLHAIADGPSGWQTLDWGIRTGLGDDRLRIGPVKIVSDGSLVGRSAAVHDCYCGEPSNFGVMQLSPEDLHEALIAYHCAGWTVATHAIGDRAIDHVLDAIEAAQTKAPRTVRHRIEHFAIATDEQVRRCAELNVIPVPQGVFISDFGDGILDAVGPGRAAGTYRMRSLLDAGMVVPGSTDSPVSNANPLVSIHDLVNRITSSGQEFGPSERVSVEEALVAYTFGSAYAVGVEEMRGRLMPDQLADFTVLSHDILRIDPAGIRDIGITGTVIGGELAYESSLKSHVNG
ncbi:amidohydrolase [Rhodococcus sp. T2V]|uniref:amidohydrolase n=1 Tax=Rhodococcus sp. T2V TaxID=3034164 RepID=UPI0023E2B8EE|nr:amidohydrolase [Rhodococcus sp. T2V]MDF3311453.1 amidohydrolase [Rhodococcus sp. T2V]